MILVIYAHPYPQYSRVCRTMIDAVRDLPDVEIHALYDRYPDFDIDIDAEQQALLRADLVVWLHPFYWYSVPALLKHWFDKVLVRGWAFGEGGTALHGKQTLWVISTGGTSAAYGPEGMHQRPFTDFIAPVEQTAKFCGMHWQTPIVVHGAHTESNNVIQAAAQKLRTRLQAFAKPGS